MQENETVISSAELAELVADTYSKNYKLLGNNGHDVDGNDFLDKSINEIIGNIRALDDGLIEKRLVEAWKDPSKAGFQLSMSNFNIVTLYAIACYALYGTYLSIKGINEFSKYANERTNNLVREPASATEPSADCETEDRSKFQYNTGNGVSDESTLQYGRGNEAAPTLYLDESLNSKAESNTRVNANNLSEKELKIILKAKKKARRKEELNRTRENRH